MAEMLHWKKFPALREFLGLQNLSHPAPGQRYLSGVGTHHTEEQQKK